MLRSGTSGRMSLKQKDKYIVPQKNNKFLAIFYDFVKISFLAIVQWLRELTDSLSCVSHFV